MKSKESVWKELSLGFDFESVESTMRRLNQKFGKPIENSNMYISYFPTAKKLRESAKKLFDYVFDDEDCFASEAGRLIVEKEFDDGKIYAYTLRYIGEESSALA